MKKRILSLIICLMFAFSLGIVSVNAEETVSFEITPLIDYDNEKITITGVTPALYAQNVSVVIYAPDATITGMADVENRLNPETQYPLNITKLKKIANVTASLDGKFEISFNLADLSAGYYVVSASGGGYKKAVSKDSELIYFENVNSINTVTIPAFNDATADTVEPLIREKELLIGIDVAEDYENNKDVINSLFETIKTDDYPDGYGNGEMYKIQDTFSAINIFRAMYAAKTTDELISILESNASILGVDIDDKDYTEDKTAVAQIFLNIIKEGKENRKYVPCSMLDTRKVFVQSMGIVALNSCDNESVSGVLDTYGEVIGLDMENYEDTCKEYGVTKVNKGFVERNFKVASDVLKAYDECVEFLETEKEKNESSSGGSGGSGGGGGGGLGGSKPSQNKKEEISIDKDIIEENLPKEEVVQKFSDVGKEHWAYEAVQTLAEIGVVDGFEDGTFKSNDLVTREQFVKMLIVTGGYLNNEIAAQFGDVEADRWSSAYIGSAVSRGIVTGYEDGTFRPTATLTRQDAAVMAYRLCNIMKKTVSKSDMLSFTDAQSVASYAVEAVATLENSGVINGFEDGSFSPLGTLTRAQAAKIIYGIVIK